MGLLEYIWLDADLNLRSKIRIVDFNVKKMEDIPVWNFNFLCPKGLRDFTDIRLF